MPFNQMNCDAWFYYPNCNMLKQLKSMMIEREREKERERENHIKL